MDRGRLVSSFAAKERLPAAVFSGPDDFLSLSPPTLLSKVAQAELDEIISR